MCVLYGLNGVLAAFIYEYEHSVVHSSDDYVIVVERACKQTIEKLSSVVRIFVLVFLFLFCGLICSSALYESHTHTHNHASKRASKFSIGRDKQKYEENRRQYQYIFLLSKKNGKKK